eukprot:NODE_118_length_1367_cov_631.739757_g96_i0.p4 GENE.NODE_118_length_1367_cov_631.739757_g96_i0~~NODE_118_length_1367_cov_631.739757_g96_i0.p4  ORF type:complete len:56 (-),score=18.82 NODE_118_length_1367_cov_631.739757_g96_i0:527-694(-)
MYSALISSGINAEYMGYYVLLLVAGLEDRGSGGHIPVSVIRDVRGLLFAFRGGLY